MKLRLSGPATLLLVSAFLLAGCDSPPRHRAAPQADAVRPVALRGASTFFTGKLRVEVSISRGRPLAGDERGPGGPRGGGGGGRRHHGGGGMGGPPPGSDDDGERAMRLATSPLPPVTLRVKLENLSKELLDLQVRDVNSDLGNFVVHPDRLALAPGQSAEVDPMVSQLGAVSDELPVTISLRLQGQTETQQVTVKSIAPTAPPAP